MKGTGSILLPTPQMYVGGSKPPSWIAPLTQAVMNGDGPEETVNGIASDPDGDLVFYRRLCDDDVKRFPELLGVSSVYIIVNIDGGN